MSTGPVDNSGHSAFALELTAVELVSKTPTSRPGRSCTSTPGLADQKDTDRLMDIMPPCPHWGQP